MRLIDADLLIERIGFYNTQQEREENAGQIITLEDFDDMPTAYDVDKVVEKIKTDASVKLFGSQNSNNYMISLDKVIEIVKAGGIDE